MLMISVVQFMFKSLYIVEHLLRVRENSTTFLTDFGVHCEMTTKRKERKKNPDTCGENARHVGLSRHLIATINLCKRR